MTAGIGTPSSELGRVDDGFAADQAYEGLQDLDHLLIMSQPPTGCWLRTHPSRGTWCRLMWGLR